MDDILIKCSDCSTITPITNFSKNKGRKNGVNAICKQCESIRAKEYNARPEIKAKNKERNKKWLADNREYKNKYTQEWYRLNKEHKNKKVQEWKEKNADRYKKVRNEYYQKNKKRLLEYQYERRKNNPNYIKEYASKNKEQLDEKRREYEVKRKKENIQFKLRCNLRGRIYKAIVKFNYKRKNTSIKELGCSIEEYVKYLETQFESGMSWENYGELWEIDHIYPISKGGSFHYTNTQPLTTLENSIKGDTIPTTIQNIT